MTTLYDQLGGHAAVNTAVDRFYQIVLADERIAHFFEGLDITAQANKQKAFMTMAFGGPSDYSGKDLSTAHAHLVAEGLEDIHFDAVVDDLRKTLQELHVPQNLQEQVLKTVESTRDAVLCRLNVPS